MRRGIFFLLLFSSLHAVQKISILIPCHYSHFYLLPELLTAYATQTLLPDEVVISLSEFDRVSPPDITALETRSWPFEVILLRHPSPYPAAQNRKFAAKASSGDLLLFQDADDLPHPKRVEIVKYIFEHNQIHHLVHSYVPQNGQFPDYSSESMPLIRSTFDLLVEGIPSEGANIPLHHGHACMTRSVIASTHWKKDHEPGEDLHFNILAMRKFMGASYVTPLRLVLFRSDLSYFSNLR